MAGHRRPSLRALCGAVLGAAVSADAAAQTMSANASEFNGGYGRYNGQENRGDGASLVGRDSNGNREIVNGILQTGAATVSARAIAAGAASAGFSGGVGAGGAMAVGNSLTVITQGDFNTVIVDSTQINNGDVIANSNVSGGVGE